MDTPDLSGSRGVNDSAILIASRISRSSYALKLVAFRLSEHLCSSPRGALHDFAALAGSLAKIEDLRRLLQTAVTAECIADPGFGLGSASGSEMCSCLEAQPPILDFFLHHRVEAQHASRILDSGPALKGFVAGYTAPFSIYGPKSTLLLLSSLSKLMVTCLPVYDFLVYLLIAGDGGLPKFWSLLPAVFSAHDCKPYLRHCRLTRNLTDFYDNDLPWDEFRVLGSSPRLSQGFLYLRVMKGELRQDWQDGQWLDAISAYNHARIDLLCRDVLESLFPGYVSQFEDEFARRGDGAANIGTKATATTSTHRKPMRTDPGLLKKSTEMLSMEPMTPAARHYPPEGSIPIYNPAYYPGDTQAISPIGAMRFATLSSSPPSAPALHPVL